MGSLCMLPMLVNDYFIMDYSSCRLGPDLFRFGHWLYWRSNGLPATGGGVAVSSRGPSFSEEALHYCC